MANKKPTKKHPSQKELKYEALMQQLFQAKADGNKRLIRFYTDMLLALEKRDKGK